MTVKINKIMKQIGNQISDYRKQHHITQSQLAKASKIPQASIVRIEHGKNTSIVTLAKIAVVINMKLGLNAAK